MISRVEHIGQPAQAGWPKRLRRFWSDLFGSAYVRLLERDLVQARLERDRAQTELRATQERLLETMAATKGIPWRPVVSPTNAPEKEKADVRPTFGMTSWQHIQAEAIAENARLEAEEKQNAPAKEN
jgi:hypothetical protein